MKGSRPPHDPVLIAEMLKDARAVAGLTQKELAALCGIGWKTLSSIETPYRDRTISLGQLLAILAACNVTFVEFATAYETRRRLIDMDGLAGREGGAAASGQGNRRPGERMEGPR